MLLESPPSPLTGPQLKVITKSRGDVHKVLRTLQDPMGSRITLWKEAVQQFNSRKSLAEWLNITTWFSSKTKEVFPEGSGDSRPCPRRSVLHPVLLVLITTPPPNTVIYSGLFWFFLLANTLGKMQTHGSPVRWAPPWALSSRWLAPWRCGGRQSTSQNIPLPALRSGIWNAHSAHGRQTHACLILSHTPCPSWKTNQPGSPGLRHPGLD